MNTDAARALLREVRQSHPMCCTLCMRCRNCDHPCQQVRLAEALCQAFKVAR